MSYQVITKDERVKFEEERDLLEYQSLDDAESAFLQLVRRKMDDTYLTGKCLSTLDIDRQTQRLRSLVNTTTRFKMGEIKKARYDFRDCTFTLKRK